MANRRTKAARSVRVIGARRVRAAWSSSVGSGSRSKSQAAPTRGPKNSAPVAAGIQYSSATGGNGLGTPQPHPAGVGSGKSAPAIRARPTSFTTPLATM